jgi:hypothetical protein
MIYSLIILVLLFCSLLPMRRESKVLTVALSLGCIGLLVASGIIQNAISEQSVISIPLMLFLLMQSLFSEVAEEELLTAPVCFLVYLGLSELEYLNESYALLFSLIAFVLFSPSEKKKRLTLLILPLLGFLSLRLSYLDLIGPVDPHLSSSSFSNLVLPSFSTGSMNVTYLICILSTGMSFLIHKKCSFSAALFILINYYFLEFEISTGVMYATFLVLSLFIFLRQFSSKEPEVLALLILLIFQFHNELSGLVLIYIFGNKLITLLPVSAKEFLNRLDWRLLSLTLILLSSLYFKSPFARMAVLLIILLGCHLNHSKKKELVV